jgi:hypothetical protein
MQSFLNAEALIASWVYNETVKNLMEFGGGEFSGGSSGGSFKKIRKPYLIISNLQYCILLKWKPKLYF